MGFHRYFLGKDPLSLFPRFFNVARSAPRMLCRESSVALEADSWSEPGIWSVMVHSLGSSGAAWRDSKTMELLCFMGWDWIYTCIYNSISIYIYICVCVSIYLYIYDHTHAYDIYIYNIHIYVYRERCINKCNHNIYIYTYFAWTYGSKQLKTLYAQHLSKVDHGPACVSSSGRVGQYLG